MNNYNQSFEKLVIYAATLVDPPGFFKFLTKKSLSLVRTSKFDFLNSLFVSDDELFLSLFCFIKTETSKTPKDPNDPLKKS